MLMSLEERRLWGDLIETYKIITGKENIDREQFFKLSNNQHNLRGHRLKIEKERNVLLMRRRFFSQRVVDIWNSLASTTVEAKTTISFKDKIDRDWSGIWAHYRRLVSSLQIAHLIWTELNWTSRHLTTMLHYSHSAKRFA